MHARIRHYQAVGLPLETLYASGRQLLTGLGQIPGFVSFVMLDVDAGGLACVYVCDGLAALEAADRVADHWLAAHRVPSDGHTSETTSGEVVLQRGL